LEPEFIRFAYNHNKLQSHKPASSIACTNSALAVELEILWDQLEQLSCLVQPNG
jgi:hypothetical protein